jgi:PPK2 family polyphosphate:nucleotide phosphotransferase
MSPDQDAPPPDAEGRARVVAALRVEPGTPADLAGLTTTWTPPPGVDAEQGERLAEAARAVLARGVDELADAQELLWASDDHALLVVFQAMDAAGKDSTIKHVMTGVNPQGVHVVSFKQPSSEELDHTFLWRTAKAAPERGQIGIFNRSHYEEVVALRVHPEWLARQKLPEGDRGPGFWQERYDDINAFERHLSRNGTKIVKFFLHVSRAEQKRRFLRRLDNPDKLWKFSASDLDDRALWDDYMRAYDDALSATSTPWAPWYVLPADDKKVMQALANAVIVDAVRSLDLRWPTVSDEDRRKNELARQALAEEA